MWRDTIKTTSVNIEIECTLYMLNLAGLCIGHGRKRGRNKWNELYLLDKLADMLNATCKGEVEISKVGYMAYLREFMPGISEDYYISHDKHTLGEEIEKCIQAAKRDGYEIGVPPKNPKHPVTVSCTIDTDGQEGVSDAQAKALDYIEANDEALCKLILEALHTEYQEAEREGYFIEDFKAKISSSDDLRSLCKCHGIHITQEHHKGMAYAEYSFQVAWLGPDQWLTIVLHADRLIHVGGSGEGWEDPEA